MWMSRARSSRTAAFAVGIVDRFDRGLDPVDRALGQPEDEAVALGVESLEGVERFVDAAGPAASLAIFDIAACRRRLVDRLAEARGQSPVVGGVADRGEVQLAEQGRVALSKLDDHSGENPVWFPFEVSADAREHARARFAAVAGRVRGERSRHHVLAEAIIVEGRTVALALDRLARAKEIDAVVFRSAHSRQHAPRLDREDIDAPLPMVGLAAGEGASREPLQSRDVEALEVFDRHAAERPLRPIAARQPSGGRRPDSSIRDDSTGQRRRERRSDIRRATLRPRRRASARPRRSAKDPPAGHAVLGETRRCCRRSTPCLAHPPQSGSSEAGRAPRWEKPA